MRKTWGERENSQGAVSMNLLVKVLVLIGSTVSVGFGVWHFFVPTWWDWYSYIDSSATELVLAVRAINGFFSLSLVLLGVVNVLLVWGKRSNRYSIAVFPAATCVLWMARVVFQLVYPQGSANPVLQFGMLAAFIIVFLCYAASLVLVASGKARA
jgi:hypothetical protein